MTTATRRHARRLLLASLVLGAIARPARALTLDDRGEMRLGLRAYTAARIGTEKMAAATTRSAFRTPPPVISASTDTSSS